MKLNVLFVILAIYMFLSAIGFLLAPDTMLTQFGFASNPEIVFTARQLGGVILFMALIAWLARGWSETAARRGVVLGFVVFWAFALLHNIYIMSTGMGGSPFVLGIAIAIVFLFLLGYFLWKERIPA